MDNRYRYLDSHGQPQGPVWLADMRRRWQSGRLAPDTLVCVDEDHAEWAPASTFPEITSLEALLPPSAPPARAPRSNSFSWVMWTVLLVAAVFMWAVSYFFRLE